MPPLPEDTAGRCERYLMAAAEALEAAERAKDPNTRDEFLNLANAWIAIAECIKERR